ncbi:FusB/FusC family EF-G-binding protein [Halobacillus litoralis]|uniref:FusB/FusC family EF-G-binding protein n=1 Tax=Halobacillus litoralis TaxID=45668 RepID=UPI001CD661FC|nr:FusB/FusC family EF-G-binding protein [Halobacillus litoralis]MCA0970208.1 FusB/FusC family EF-G-binding protein [Halobacillus litoralis]
MESFIRADQYHYIEKQTASLVNSHSSTNDQAVASAMMAITQEKVVDAFLDLTEEQQQMIAQVNQIKDEADALFFLSRLKQYIIPFPNLTEKEIKDLFPKVKRLQVPDLTQVPWNHISYLSWNEPGSGRKYIITHQNDEWTGLKGDFLPSNKTGICAICHETESVGLFTTTNQKSRSEETVSRGNYICQNSVQCNHNIKNRKPLDQFVERLKG